jgi:signal transduction histidine kinase
VIRFLVAPWRRSATWRELAHLALDFPLGILSGVIISVLVSLSIALAVTFVVAVPLAWFTFVVAAGFGSLERSRAAALLDVDLSSPHAPFRPGSWWSRLRQRLASASRWREIAYLSLGLPLLGVLGLAVLFLWALSLTLLVLPVVIVHLPGRSADFGWFRLHSGSASVAALAVGVVLFGFVSPHLTTAVASLHRRAVRWLLGPRPQSELARRVDELEMSRGAAVDSAEAERRRIERDLHDGAQQRLVALAMDLSRARERFDTDPEKARQLVDDAHEEAKAALVELRDLARGIHPAVLTDRGLDAALSAVIARCPVPVTLSIDMTTAPPAPVESAAYFVVAETLTNVAKHARAHRAQVTIAMRNNQLVIDVADDGVGGADLSGGTGLAGLADRVSALGGWMRVLSPAGGPTSVMVELPCAS